MRALFFIVEKPARRRPLPAFESIAVRPDVVVQGRAQEDWSRALVLMGGFVRGRHEPVGRYHRQSLSSQAEWTR